MAKRRRSSSLTQASGRLDMANLSAAFVDRAVLLESDTAKACLSSVLAGKDADDVGAKVQPRVMWSPGSARPQGRSQMTQHESTLPAVPASPAGRQLSVFAALKRLPGSTSQLAGRQDEAAPPARASTFGPSAMPFPEGKSQIEVLASLGPKPDVGPAARCSLALAPESPANGAASEPPRSSASDAANCSALAADDVRGEPKKSRSLREKKKVTFSKDVKCPKPTSLLEVLCLTREVSDQFDSEP